MTIIFREKTDPPHNRLRLRFQDLRNLLQLLTIDRLHPRQGLLHLHFKFHHTRSKLILQRLHVRRRSNYLYILKQTLKPINFLLLQH